MRNYGLKVGDIVSYDRNMKQFTVHSFPFMDNNACLLEDETGKQIKAVCEWCEIIKNKENV